VLNGNLFPYSFSDIWAQFTGMSSSLAALSPTGSITTTTINGVANADGVAVLTVPLSTLNSLTGTLSFTGCLALSLTTPCDGVILVTNTDTSHTTFNNTSLSYGALTSAQKNLIWVFEPPSGGVGGITQVDISGEWWASILAVGADVENTAPIVGNTIANTVDASGGNGEFHIPQFDCSDNLCGSLAPPPPMPEPGSLALLATGLAGAAFVGWRRRRNTTPALP
jgi:choice-of-anchor A domain-containing protein